MSVAQRVAEEMDVSLGQEVGYSIRSADEVFVFLSFKQKIYLGKKILELYQIIMFL